MEKGSSLEIGYSEDSASPAESAGSSVVDSALEKLRTKDVVSGGYEESSDVWSPESAGGGATTDAPSAEENDPKPASHILRNKNNEPFEWTPYAELHLLNSLRGLRPVGANFHFYINVVHNRFNAAMGMDIPRSVLLKKINTYYNLDEALKICGEDVPTNQREFSLPKDEFPEYAKLLKQFNAEKKD
ncbi:hypothetical protein O3M35_006863 [Rhynocoris fuscipes]|uniref:Uncharacterized protein n=1 Tax=Rhynocoris fuscipes TaxID=488301 RepID=A0AAW1DHG1_9HEMI